MTQKRSTSKNRKLIAFTSAFLTLITLLSLTSALLYNHTEQIREDHEYEVSLLYHNLIDEIQDFTHQNISLLSGFSAYIQMNDDYTDEEIYTYLNYLLKDELDDIRNIGIFEDTTIMWVYPLEGNESAIGVDLSKVPDQKEAVMRVKENLETLFVGPVDLVQGGVGFIIRMPLMKDGDFWGMVSIVLRAEQAFAFIDHYSNQHQMAYLITHADNPNDIIYGNAEVLDMSPLKFRTEDSLGGWDVYTAPLIGWKNYRSLFVGLFALCGLISFIISRFIYLRVVNYELMLKDKIELEKKYTLDRFTGIYTREHFNMRVEEEFSQSLRHNYPLSMVYFDLDHFKNVNDTYGHSVGDEVLLQVVEIVKTIIRIEDVFARWGGDEFILLLPYTDLANAKAVSERIRKEIETLDLCQTLGVTASIGYSQWQKLEYLESWFSRTDKALYIAKNTGRNKITASHQESETNILVKIEWDNAWNCNHPVINAEHKGLLDRCNAIIESSLSKQSHSETLRNVSAFLQEIEQHFKNEIAILKEMDYPDVKEHEKIHHDILKQSKAIYKKTVQESISPIELFHFLLIVVVEKHLKNEDIKYFKYL